LHPQQVVQACHAAIQAANEGHYSTLEEVPYLVVCGVKNKRRLESARRGISSAGVSCTLFYEPDISEHTALATEPVREENRHLFRKFQCLKERV
jgi:hypothetical protein